MGKKSEHKKEALIRGKQDETSAYLNDQQWTK